MLRAVNRRRPAHENNQRKNRHGAFWEDRYHATAIEAEEHLQRCLVYIDLNMVRAGLVNHPSRWVHSGYREIQKPPKRYGVIDLRELTGLCGFADSRDFQTAHRQWVDRTLERGLAVRDDRWSESIAVGSLSFVENVKRDLGSRAAHRAVEENHGAYALRERSEPYSSNLRSETEPLSGENTVFWDENGGTADT